MDKSFGIEKLHKQQKRADLKKSALFLNLRLFFLFCAKVKYKVKSYYIYQKQSYNAQGIKYLVAVYKAVYYIVGGAVAAAEEHIVIIQQLVCKEGGAAKAEKNGKGYPDIALFHACHSGYGYVKGCKAGNGVGKAGNHVIEAQNGITAVILPCKICAHNRAQQAEDEHEIQCRVLYSALCKGGKGNGDKLNTAQKQRQIIKPRKRILRPHAYYDKLEKLCRIYEYGGNDEHAVFGFFVFIFVF